MIAMPISSCMIGGLAAALATIQFFPVPHPWPTDHVPLPVMRMAAAGAALPAVRSADFTDAPPYRDRARPLLWRTDPMTAGNIRKNLPTARPTIDAPARGKALEIPSQPAACEAIMSTIVDPTLSRLVGRCFA